MKILHCFLLLVCVTLFGCSGTLEPVFSQTGVDAGENTDTNVAKSSFEEDVTPLLNGFCAACHSSANGIGFMLPEPDIYGTVKEWPLLVNIETPSDSRLLAKGVHDGPAWTADQNAIIRKWIDLEAEVAGIEIVEEFETPAFKPLVGGNTVDLESLGLEGSTLTFNLEVLSVGYYLSEIKVNAGPKGAHLVHPLFVPWIEGTPKPDPVDRFSEVDMTVQANQSSMVGNGTLVLIDIPAESQLSVHFETVGFADGTTPTDPNNPIPEGGCSSIAAFTNNAQSPLSSSCSGCHGGDNSSATNAVDMSKINELDDNSQASACGQILSRINLEDPVQSGLFTTVDPNSNSQHPFKFNNDNEQFMNFRNALLVWIVQE